METKSQAEIYNNYKNISDEWWHHNVSQLNEDRLRNLVIQLHTQKNRNNKTINLKIKKI